ncbi:unnamed protein product [Adineta steineri]|uniref:Uncharacterized protein n=1 Tax=Adineta steineri TaxID=433720 RepID=A0A815JV85_9BILA|nr:unnamed protein product [Adineta steineri]
MGVGERPRPDTTSKSTEIKIWVQFDRYQATRVTLDNTSIIDDLIGVALNGEGRRNEYQAHYRNRELGPGERIPSDTESDHPVVLRKIIIRPPRDPNPTGPKPYTPTEYHIVIDNSNVFLGAQLIRNEKTGVTEMNPATRVNVGYLTKKIEGGKLNIDIRTRIVGGTKPPENVRVWREWDSNGYKCMVIDRAATGKESALDDLLHAQILILLRKYEIYNRQQVLVLVTGDGNTNYNRGGFLNVVEIALKDKWNVELWSWELSLSQRFFEIQKLFPTQLTIKYLDPLRKYEIYNRQQVLVLVTGDGNTNYNRGGFLNVVEIALKDKWNVELWSWELSLSQRFFEIQKLFPTQLTIKYLDPHRTNVTFEEKSKQN